MVSLCCSVQTDIAARNELPEGPGLGRVEKRRSQTAEKYVPLLRLIREGEQSDDLVRLDQNRDGDADERQAPGEVEP